MSVSCYYFFILSLLLQTLYFIWIPVKFSVCACSTASELFFACVFWSVNGSVLVCVCVYMCKIFHRRLHDVLALGGRRWILYSILYSNSRLCVNEWVDCVGYFVLILVSYLDSEIRPKKFIHKIQIYAFNAIVLKMYYVKTAKNTRHSLWKRSMWSQYMESNRLIYAATNRPVRQKRMQNINSNMISSKTLVIHANSFRRADVRQTRCVTRTSFFLFFSFRL